MSAEGIFGLRVERCLLRALRLVAKTHAPEAPFPEGGLAEVEAAIAVAERDDDHPMARLARELSLTADEQDFAWSAVAAAADPRIQPHLDALFGAAVRRGAGVTPAAHAALAGHDERGALTLAHTLREGSRLLDEHLLAAVGDRTVVAATLVCAAPRLVSYLAGRDSIDPEVARFGGAITVPARPRLDPHQERTCQQIARAIAAATPPLVVIEGPVGAGRRTAAAMAAGARGAVSIDAVRIEPTAEAVAAALHGLHRESRLGGALVVIENAEAWTRGGDVAPLGRLLAELVERVPGPVALTTSGGVELHTARPVLRVEWRVAEHATRRQLWHDALGPDGAPLHDVIGQLAHRYRLGPGGIGRAVVAARLHAERAGDATAPALRELVAGVRSNTADRLGSLIRRREPSETWEDLVLAEDAIDQLRALIARVRFGHRVYEEWGFQRRAARGVGVPVLFSGPPGTGKTMAAGIVARELELELYQVDLSQVVSKWVGETEKNLGEVFAAAEAGHALILFDEADALFAKRSAEVRGAQDRYANLEVNYLLQRIEAFSGIAILTTNMDASIDAALKRRLAAHVVFWAPDQDERTELWRRLLSASDAPIDRDALDLEGLSREFSTMSGANIRNAVLGAAFLAATDGTAITQQHLERAARGEYRTMGRVLSSTARG